MDDRFDFAGACSLQCDEVPFALRKAIPNFTV